MNIGTQNQLKASTVLSVTVTDVDLPVADPIRVLGVLAEPCLSFDHHNLGGNAI